MGDQARSRSEPQAGGPLAFKSRSRGLLYDRNYKPAASSNFQMCEALTATKRRKTKMHKAERTYLSAA